MLSLIVLAAGKSSRMHGRNKLLAKINRKPMIRRVVEAALSSQVDEVIVVLGWEADKVRDALSELPCRFVVNKNYEEGQSSSVKAGLKEVAEAAKAILILPGDIAMIDTRSINLVVNEYNLGNSLIVVAAYRGNPGHPILLSKELFDEVQEIDEQGLGLKSVLKNHAADVRLVETDHEYVLRDVDTPEDLKQL
jgi:molybdenum cofactor cytidylyltransferase